MSFNISDKIRNLFGRSEVLKSAESGPFSAADFEGPDEFKVDFSKLPTQKRTEQSYSSSVFNRPERQFGGTTQATGGEVYDPKKASGNSMLTRQESAAAASEQRVDNIINRNDQVK